MRKKEFITYTLWCFGLTWICKGIIIINSYYDIFPDAVVKIVEVAGAFAPTLAVVLLLKKYGAVEGRTSIKQFIFDFPKEIGAYGILTIYLGWRFLAFLINGNMAQGEPLYMLFPFLLVQLFFQGGFEEPGWRGFLQPYFEKKYHIIISIVLVSIIWAIWHIPLWFVAGSVQSEMSFLIFFLQILVNSCSLAAILKLTKSVAFCIVHHAWCNAVFLVIPFDMNAGIVIAYSVEAIVSLAICLIYNNRIKQKSEHNE